LHFKTNEESISDAFIMTSKLINFARS